MKNSKDTECEKAEEWRWRRLKKVEGIEDDEEWKWRCLQIKKCEDGKGRDDEN